MPRFYFHLHNSIDVRDDEGTELPDLDAARREARRSAAELIAEELIAGRTLKLNHRIDVADESGEIVLTLEFRDLVEEGD